MILFMAVVGDEGGHLMNCSVLAVWVASISYVFVTFN